MVAPTHVCHVCTGIDVGGAEKQLLSIASGQVERGYDVTVVALKGDDELRDQFEAAGCTVLNVGIRADVDPIGFARLVRFLRRDEFDIVHGHLFHGNVYGIAAGRLAGVPYLVSSKHNDPPYWERQPWKTIHDATLRQLNAVLPISDHVHRYLLEASAVDPAKVATVRYGFDPSVFDEVSETDIRSARREFVDTEQPLVGTVARLTEQKNLETLLQVFERVHRDVPDAHLAVVGRGELRDELEALASSLEIDDSVTFTGFRTDIPALMHAFDVFFLPSKWEGFGVVFMEAMAAETPVVASNVSAIPEVVLDGDTGLLADPTDEDALVDALGTLLGDQVLAEKMGNRGRTRLETELTAARMVGEVVAVYERLLE